MRSNFFKLILFLTFFISYILFAKGQEQTNERAMWFTDARFGMFIHWGVYSGAEGFWKGEKLRNDNDYAEWILYRNRIEKNEYLTLLDRFAWNEIDPEEWVLLAKNSGMKYVTITAKHHDGFGLWDSRVSNYDLGDYTNPKRDIIKELADACKKHGLKLGLYYSHWVDWEHKFGWDHTREISGISAEDYNQYWQEKVIPQMQELLTNYGEIGMIWFDMWIHHSRTVVTKKQLLQLKGLIRDLQPNCLVNSRLGLSVEEDQDIDFKTLGDNQLGIRKENFPWQSPATVAHSWGFHSLDSEWKSTTTLLKSLISNVSLNGNFMLNIGPRANGNVPFEIRQRMLEMGKWLEVNGESIYGSEAFDLNKDQHDWGKITCKKTIDGFKLYLHVFTWPLNKKLNLTGVSEAPNNIYLLADKNKSPLLNSHSGAHTKISLPTTEPDPFISVVVLEYNKKPLIEDYLVAKTIDDGYSLTPQNQIIKDEAFELNKKGRRGTVPQHVNVVKEKTFVWKIYVDEPGAKNIDVSYSFQFDSNKSKLELKVAGTTVSHTILPTGKTVGEPNQNWVIDNYKSNRLGKINFPEKGIYEIKLKFQPKKQEEVKFHWVWVK
ncbi:MAG: alpha-L-fucosidase [Prolixibacteraceae bacterium]|jgi:alpha-L-fucosidase|nr:alpha-L-fucosidase [Prolixibacteraceae bacterium]MBT6763375.1 alpha-L-fucosidase [Prolixibacteraceae bacterium]MBT6997185.1 alpha-L-fucosidase [Prolixibacteraceae bacterium]MBT7396515.1 alpha-L-fucosidase [Prolixibacteraceae bacterium]